MPTSSMPPVGERIRTERLRRGMSLRALARTVGVSASLVSQVETGKSQPSVSTLYAITTALGISIEDVFDARGAAAVPGGGASGRPGPPGRGRPEGAGADEGAADPADLLRRVGPLVRPAQREKLELEPGVTWQRLGRIPGTTVDFLLITYPPGSSSSGSGQLMRHPGSEYGYLVEGELVLTLGFDEYRLAPGDAISFESATPHRYRNDGTRPAVGVWFVSETGR
jgi:transcriptional regulator with XRE-family HTH domain